MLRELAGVTLHGVHAHIGSQIFEVEGFCQSMSILSDFTRDDDFDESSLKRRAVSPGVSVHNSPIISQSPAQRDGSLWGTATKANRETPNGGSNNERTSSAGSASMSMTPTLGPKRIGLQGMTDTYDGLMNMSIE